MGLPKAIRLKHWEDFQAVYQQGKRYRESHLMLRVLRDSSLSVSRFGIAVSQKISKKAVVRNRIKRRIRAAIQALLPDCCPGWNIIIVVLPSGIVCKYEHFLRELKQLFNKAEIMTHGY